MIKHLVLTLLTVVMLLQAARFAQAEPSAPVQNTCTDPRIAYSTFIGGELEENANDVAVDANGHVYIGGTSYSTFFPARHGVDVVGVGLNADGSALENLYWVNPAQVNDREDQGYATAIDAAGNRYVAGFTSSAEFCSTIAPNPVGADTTYNENIDGFLVKINASDGEIGYCTFVGGSELDLVYDIVAAPDGTVHLLGDTYSVGDFPNTVAADHSGARDLFVTSIAPDGSAFGSTTLIGGSGNDQGRGIALAPNGDRYVTGWSFSADFPTTATAFQTSQSGNADGFVVKLDSNDDVAYATYLGGDDVDRGYAIAVDAAGAAHVVGFTKSADFPTSANAFDATYSGTGFTGSDAFMAILSADGTALNYSTYLGGDQAEFGYGLQLVGDDVYMVGETTSADFPLTANALDSTLAPNDFGDGWLMRFSKSANAPTFSTFWGGAEQDRLNDVAVDQAGNVYVVGEGKSAEICTSPTAFDRIHGGDSDMLILKLKPADLTNTYLPFLTTP